MDIKRALIALGCLTVLVGGYFLLKFIVFDQVHFAQKQLGDPTALAPSPGAAPPPKPSPPPPAPVAKEYTVWFRVSGTSPEAKVTYTDAAGEKGGVVVPIPWQVASPAREGDHVVLVADNQSSKDLVTEIFVAERGSAGDSESLPAGAVPWQRATVGSYGIGRCEGIVGK
jgi:hypothetical protein